MLSAIFRISSRGIFPMIVSSAQFETVQKPCTYSKTNKFRPTPYRLDGIGLSDRTSKSSHGGSHIEQSIFFPLHHRDNRNSPASLLFRIFLLKSGFQILPLSMQCLSMFHLFLAKRLSKRFLKPMPDRKSVV